MKVIHEQFDGLGQYLHTIESRRPNKVFQHKKLSSEDSGRAFTLTESYDEANTLARNGYMDGLDKIKAAGTKSRHMGSAPKALPAMGVVGFAPHVPNAITGVPLSMITKTQVEQKAKVISVLYYMGGAARVGAQEFVDAGKNILNVIYSLELQGYRVALYVMTTFCEPSERAICTVQIKHWRQPSNPLKIAYPLVHPSFFRRHGFRWLETQPDLTDKDFPAGYGYPLDIREGSKSDDRRKWLREQGILQTGWFYTEREEACKKEADELIKIMGIEKGSTERKAPRKPVEPERGMGIRLEDMELPDFVEPDGLPDFSFKDLGRKKWY